MGDGSDGEYGEIGLGLAHIAGELGHGPAEAGDGVFVGPVVRLELAFQDDLGPGDRLAVLADTLDQLHRTVAEAAGDGELVEAQRSRGGLEGGGHIDRWVEADAAGGRKRLAHGPGLLQEHPDMPADTDAHADPVGSLHAHAMDGDVGHTGLGVLRAEQAQVEERPSVFRRALDGGDGGAQIERRLDDHFLAGRLRSGHDHRGDGVPQGTEKVEGQAPGLATQQEGGPFPTGQDPGHYPHVGALDLVEHHGGADLGGWSGRSPRADPAVHTGDLEVGIDFHVGGHQLARSLGQEIQCGAKVRDLTAIHKISLSIEGPF